MLRFCDVIWICLLGRDWFLGVLIVVVDFGSCLGTVVCFAAEGCYSVSFLV